MKMKKSLKQLVAGVLLGVMVCTGFTPASVNAAAKPAVKSVTATAYGTVCNGKTIYMVKGKKTTIGVSVNPAKAKKSVKLSSSKKKVVKAKGKKLTAKKVGTAKITVKVKGKNGKTKKVKFTVKVVKSASQIPSGAIGGTKKTSSGTNTKKTTNTTNNTTNNTTTNTPTASTEETSNIKVTFSTVNVTGDTVQLSDSKLYIGTAKKYKRTITATVSGANADNIVWERSTYTTANILSEDGANVTVCAYEEGTEDIIATINGKEIGRVTVEAKKAYNTDNPLDESCTHDECWDSTTKHKDSEFINTTASYGNVDSTWRVHHADATKMKNFKASIKAECKEQGFLSMATDDSCTDVELAGEIIKYVRSTYALNEDSEKGETNPLAVYEDGGTYDCRGMTTLTICFFETCGLNQIEPRDASQDVGTGSGSMHRNCMVLLDGEPYVVDGQSGRINNFWSARWTIFKNDSNTYSIVTQANYDSQADYEAAN